MSAINLAKHERLGNRFTYAYLRYPRDFRDRYLEAITPRQMADGDSDAFSETIPAGQIWLANSLSFMPANPESFSLFRKLCNDMATSRIELVIPNRETMAFVPLSSFWLEGEYLLKPNFIFDMPIGLESRSMFRMRLAFEPPKKYGDPVSSQWLNENWPITPTTGLRLTLNYTAWGMP